MNRIDPLWRRPEPDATARSDPSADPAWSEALQRNAHHAPAHTHPMHGHEAGPHTHHHAAHHHAVRHHALSQLATHTEHEQNVRDLARVITAEAGGQSEAAMRAVGWTVRNRMSRADTTHVDRVWSGYAHGTHSSEIARQVAADVIDASSPDPTGGATHFYSPDAMPKQGDPDGCNDVAGGLEQVPGVRGSTGAPARNYRPSWAAPGQFEPRPVAGVAEHVFKFYRQPGSGHVR